MRSKEAFVKRTVLFALAVLLTSAALVSSRPAYACVVNPACVSDGCGDQCPDGGICNTCTGHCRCVA
jgi:hypothetical protein